MSEDRRLAAIMFSDIVGYTALMGSDEDRAFEILRKNKAIHLKLIEKFNGSLDKELGDGLLISFKLASDAVRCAMEIQKECRDQDIPLKIGIHQGETVFAGSDVLGDGVNVATGLQENSPTGSIIISDKVYSDIKNRKDIQTRLIGKKKLREVDESMNVYHVLRDDELEALRSNDQSAKRRIWKNPVVYIAIGLSIIFIGILIIWKFIPFSDTSDLDNSIAVRPFWNESTDEAFDFFITGMTEDIRNSLSKIPGLKVRSRGATEKYQSSEHTTTDIAENLKVKYVLEGTVQKLNNQVKIDIQLILAENDDRIWDKTFIEDISNANEIYGIQSRIAESVSNELSGIFIPQEHASTDRYLSENDEANTMFQRGLDYLYRGGKSYSNIEMNFFHRAIEFDPDFALAYIWLGYAIFEKANQSIKTRRYTDTLKYYSDKAIKINPNLSDAYWLRGQYFLYNGEYDLALEDFNIAIDVNPKNGPAHKMRGMTYQRDGNYFEAHRNYMKAKQLLAGDKKFYPELLVHLGDFYQSICDSEEAEVAFKELLGYSPVLGNEKLCELAIGDGNWNNLLTYLNSICAIDAGERCARFQNDYYVFTGAFDKISTGSFLSGINFYRGIDRYGYVLVTQGRKEKSAAYFNQRIKDLEARMNRDHHSLEGYEWYELAAVYAYKGNRDKAYQMLQEIEKAKVDGFFIRFAKVDPFFENLWDDIEFQQFIRRQENRFAEIRVEINKLNEQGSI